MATANSGESTRTIGFRLAGSTCLVTGAAQGIGLALCDELRRAGAAKIIMLDRKREPLEREATRIGAVPLPVDLADGNALREALRQVIHQHGPVAAVFSNAGILMDDDEGDASGADDATWQLAWDVNVMAHARVVRELLPAMPTTGGWIVLTASAAGLLAYPDSATYSVTKHAVTAYADYLAIRYHDRIGVSVLCPQAVDTDMIKPYTNGGIAGLDGVVSAKECAALTVRAVEAGEYLILPHPEVSDYIIRRAQDHGRWLGGMRKVVRTLREKSSA